MSEVTAVLIPLRDERLALAGVLQSLAGMVSKRIEAEISLVKGFDKAAAVERVKPKRRRVFKAQMLADDLLNFCQVRGPMVAQDVCMVSGPDLEQCLHVLDLVKRAGRMAGGLTDALRGGFDA